MEKQHMDKGGDKQQDKQHTDKQNMERDKKPQVQGGERKNTEEVGEPVQLDDKSRSGQNQPHKPEGDRGGEHGGQHGGGQRQEGGLKR